MKLNYLFPNKLKKIGWMLFVPSVLIGFYSIIFDDIPSPDFLDVTNNPFARGSGFIGTDGEDNLFNEILGVILIVSSFLVAFSKEKVEDEFISKLRLESLVWATYFNYSILLISMVFFYGFDFLSVMMVNMFSLLLFFIVRFNLMLQKSNR